MKNYNNPLCEEVNKHFMHLVFLFYVTIQFIHEFCNMGTKSELIYVVIVVGHCIIFPMHHPTFYEKNLVAKVEIYDTQPRERLF